MAVTIKDVAREAGVSVASVSRALNGHDTVRQSKRRHILEVAQRLRYVPHMAARSLITRRTQAIGVLLPDLHGEFFSELIRGIDLAARARGLHILVSSSHGDATEAAATLQAMQGRVDGVLVMSPFVDSRFLSEHLHDVPVVLMNAGLDDPSVIELRIDNRGGAQAATAHLLAQGHRRIAIITGPGGTFDADQRLHGFRQALAAVNGASETVLAGDFTEQSGHAAGQAIAAMTARPDAVFACNDMMAIGCLIALREAGIEVPADIALAGFDDIPIARYLSPTLTTVRVSISQLGAQALERLAERINNPEQSGARTDTLPPELVVRESCRRPADNRNG